MNVDVMMNIVFFFFFKQKTAYEMRISDWSSDVCSSDLLIVPDRALIEAGIAKDMVESLLARNMSRIFAHDQRDLTLIIVKRTRVWPDDILLVTCDRTRRPDKCPRLGRRSEERRVGKEWVSKGSTRGGPEQYKKKT